MANSLGRRITSRFRRVILYRLIMPVLRAKYPPEYMARSVLFGLFVAMTPTVGIQMPIVALIWLAVRYTKRQWDFNVIIAMAWTWVTNVFTLAPIYYIFLVTGRIMLGSDSNFGDYGAFAEELKRALVHKGEVETLWAYLVHLVESLWIYTIRLFEIWGIPMFVGSLPWAVLSAWLGYRWSLRLVNRFRSRRAQRAEARRALRQHR